MNVKELIEALQQLPGEAEVLTFDPDYWEKWLQGLYLLGIQYGTEPKTVVLEFS